MMRTLDRYVIRETVLPFLMALGVLTFLFAISPMMERAEQLLTKGVPVGTVAYLLVNLLPQALGITLPMAFLIGLLIGLGKLSADRETVALLACGVSLWRLLRPVLAMSAVVAAACLWVMLDGIPRGNMAFVRITTNFMAQKTAQDIKPGVFYTALPGKVLYVAGVEADGSWRKVLMAMVRDNTAPTLVLAESGRLVSDAQAGYAAIVLNDVTKSMPGAEPGVYDRADGGLREEVYALDPREWFRRELVGPGIREMTIAQLREEEQLKIRLRESPHPAIIAIHQKFSFPVACLVMGLLGLALGVHTRKDGKFASFALGLALIFVYYGLMTVFESLAKGQRFPAEWARWMPNLILAPIAIAIIWWRSDNAERGLPVRWPAAWTARLQALVERRRPTTGSSAGLTKPVVVLRIPELALPRPRLIDLYLMRRYLAVVSLAFVGLLGLFYIGTVVDLSDKLFKKTASVGMLLDLLYYATPQFVYFLIPVAMLVAALVTIGGLSKTSELTVLRACGVSLYRLAVPLLLFGAVGSAVLFGLEEYVLAASNKQKTAIENVIRERPSTVIDVANRHWLTGSNGRIYYYAGFDPAANMLVHLSIFDIESRPYRVSRHTFVERAAWSQRSGTWRATTGWMQTFPRTGRVVREDFPSKMLRFDPPARFRTEDVDAQAMTVAQLGAYVKTLRASGLAVGSYAVDFHRKIAFPLMTLVMTLIAVPFGVTTGKRGALYGIGLAIALAFTYQMAFTAFGFLGTAGLLPAALAAWAPNLLFLAGALYLLLTVRT
jgi:LPS export ABC transporter permease LptG/LPS export ABC transporter permease LptF